MPTATFNSVVRVVRESEEKREGERGDACIHNDSFKYYFFVYGVISKLLSREPCAFKTICGVSFSALITLIDPRVPLTGRSSERACTRLSLAPNYVLSLSLSGG